MTTAATPPAPEAVARLEASPDAVAFFDRDWVIRYANAAAARLAGRPAAELNGRSIWVALPELGGTIFHSFLLRALSTGRAGDQPAVRLGARRAARR